MVRRRPRHLQSPFLNHACAEQNVSRLEQRDVTFSSIVDIDDETFESYVTDDLAGRLGEGDFFRMAMRRGHCAQTQS